MTLQIIAIIFISLITGFITLTFAAYQEWQIKMFERQILKCFKIIRNEFRNLEKEKNSDAERKRKNAN